MLSGMASNTEYASKDTKSHENRVRRMADRQGFEYRKSRRRDPRATDFGEIMLLRVLTRAHKGSRWEPIASPENSADCWAGPFYSPSEVEAFLLSDDAQVT
jgi:hypothetical protein